MYTLYAARGCGSVAIEAALDLLDQPYTRIEANPWEPDAAFEALCAINPLGQVPTLVGDDGVVLSESAAILFWLITRHGGLQPATVAAQADQFRWIGFLSSNIYAPIGMRDFAQRWVDGADAQAAFKTGARERIRAHWRTFAAAFTPAPYLLGKRLCALDLYAAMMSRWAETRPWLESEFTALAASIARTEAEPKVAAVWVRNF